MIYIWWILALALMEPRNFKNPIRFLMDNRNVCAFRLCLADFPILTVEYFPSDDFEFIKIYHIAIGAHTWCTQIDLCIFFLVISLSLSLSHCVTYEFWIYWAQNKAPKVTFVCMKGAVVFQKFAWFPEEKEEEEKTWCEHFVACHCIWYCECEILAYLYIN